MSTRPAVPFLPGYVRNETVPKGKSQRMSVQNGVIMVSEGPRVPAPSAEGLQAARRAEETKADSSAAGPKAGTASGAPVKSWLRFSSEALRFSGYFREPVVSSPLEKERVRRVTVIYYLSDGTLAISEHRQENSGIPQGVLLRRSRVPRPGGQPGEAVGPDDLRVGADLNLYGQTYRLVDADAFTRDFYRAELGVADLGAAEAVPVDDFTRKQEQKPDTFNIAMTDTKKFVEASLGRGHIDVRSSTKFFAKDGQVLRFYASWHDTAPYGQKRLYSVFYYLADDTIEVTELKQISGGEQPGSLLRRSRLPRDFRGSVASVASIGAAAELAQDLAQFVSEAELRVGGQLNVYGRQLLLCGCDDYTKDYYRRVYGLSEADFAPISMHEEPKPASRVPVPPPTGFGTDEDSLGSFYNLVPRPPRQDVAKLMGQDNKTLRFLARLARPAVEDAERRFVVTYYLSDDTVSVFERVVRNSGFVGGKFLQRSRAAERSPGLGAKDFFVGSQVAINHFRFVLEEADEFTLHLMEEDGEQFPQAAASAAQQRLRQAGFDARALAGLFPAGGLAGQEEVAAAVRGRVPELTAHQILSVIRRSGAARDGNKVDLAVLGASL